jgi:hypothetical protein
MARAKGVAFPPRWAGPWAFTSGAGRSILEDKKTSWWISL